MRTIPNWRRAHPLPLLLALTLVVAACGDDQTTEGTGDGGDVAVLRVGAPGQITDNLNPLLTNGLADYTAVFHIYDTLVRLTPEGTEMALATSITPNDDASVWEIEIRDDAVFHDDTPVTAADVVASLELMADPEQSPNYADFFSDIDTDGLSAAGDHTVVVPLHRPRGDFADTVLTFASFVFKEGHTDWTSPVGSGPYRLDSYEPGETTVLVANDQHWEGPPTVDRIEISTIADDATRLNGVRNDQLDLAIKVDPVGVAADADDVVVLHGGMASSQGMAVVMNTATPPFDDVEVRHAVQLTVDRQALVDTILLGFGEVGNDVIGAGFDGYHDDIPQVERDVATASDIFARHGVDELTLVVGDVTPGLVASGELLIEQFADAGVTLRLDRRDPATYYADFEEFLGRPFQALYYVNRPAPAFLGNFSGSAAFFNPSGYATPGYDDLLVEAQATIDPDEREARFREAQELFHEEGGTVVWGFQEQLDAARPGLDGIRIVQSIPFLSQVTAA